uniref:Uncharacterized protein n=1 Tax=Salmonella enteritidis TaxID=149539 RepID=A0A1S6KR27_SALEN|nr:hypothetical protein [Salmonella enterica subsp. enterica serovar Enteritidis]
MKMHRTCMKRNGAQLSVCGTMNRNFMMGMKDGWWPADMNAYPA